MHCSRYQTGENDSPSFLLSSPDSSNNRPKIIDSGVRKSGTIVLKTVDWERAHQRNVRLRPESFTVKIFSYHAVDGSSASGNPVFFVYSNERSFSGHVTEE
jgi:hypothetical protein